MESPSLCQGTATRTALSPPALANFFLFEERHQQVFDVVAANTALFKPSCEPATAKESLQTQH